MKRSGMRWRIQGGQAVLTVRALIKSGRFDRAWNALMGMADTPPTTTSATPNYPGSPHEPRHSGQRHHRHTRFTPPSPLSPCGAPRCPQHRRLPEAAAPRSSWPFCLPPAPQSPSAARSRHLLVPDAVHAASTPLLVDGPTQLRKHRYRRPSGLAPIPQRSSLQSFEISQHPARSSRCVIPKVPSGRRMLSHFLNDIDLYGYNVRFSSL